MPDWTPREQAIVERAAMELWPDPLGVDLEYNLQGLASIAQELAWLLRKDEREFAFVSQRASGRIQVRECPSCGQKAEFIDRSRSCDACKHRTKLLRAKLAAGVKNAVMERDEYRCQRCSGQHRLVVDHIVPLGRGGTNDIGNLQTLCFSCNSAKGDRVVGA